ILLIFLLASCSNYHQAEYTFVGQYEYEITNDSLFNNTYLTEDSFGYTIGDTKIQGLNIKGAESLDKSKDYIISIDNPIEAAYTNSAKVKGECAGRTSLKPLDVIKNKKIKSKVVFIYLLTEKRR